jgi:TetR/AcrR family transcriptional regulator, cholesterol catabolism regulator
LNDCDQDAEIVQPRPGLDPVEQLRFALRRVVDPEFMVSEYLGLRLQLWALAPVNPLFATINHDAQAAYRDGMTRLVAGARPELAATTAERLATDVIVIQNGIWLSALILNDPGAIERSVVLTEQVAMSSYEHAG